MATGTGLGGGHRARHRFASKHDLRIAVRGNGHSVYGQTLVKGGIVIQMSTLSKARNLPGARVLADAGCSWGAVLEETLKEGATPPVIPDYLGLSVGGTLSIGGISHFDELARAKHRYDSMNVLASGPDLFQVKT